MENRLWYDSPPKEWMEGLPIGNGRLAAMIWGDEQTDRISLNHEWLWRGAHRDRTCEPSAHHLQEVRDELKKGDFLQATRLANQYFGGNGGISGIPHRVDSYQPAGDLSFTLHDNPVFQSRELNLDQAVVLTERATEKCKVKATFIAHPGVSLILCRWRATEGCFSGSMRYTRPADPDAVESCTYGKNGIRYQCSFQGGISFETGIAIKTDGIVTVDGDGLQIIGAHELTATIDVATSVLGIESELASHQVPDSSWDALLSSHAGIFSELLGRMTLNLELPDNPLSTDRRIAGVRAGLEDAALPLLYFNFGRYLLASASLGGELPANLQGKWNDRIDPPWECDYHFDINIQMNYWMAEAANMPECAEALLQYVERFIPHARQAAEDLYGCRGVWIPMTSDAWGRATPEASGWAVWIGAAAWMAQHFWRHYEYGGDLAFLKDRAYPFFREVAEFYEDYLVEDEQGILQIMPSQSPENRFDGTGHWPVSIGISSAMDVQLAFDALGYACNAAAILSTDESPAARWKDMQRRLPPFRIGSDGRLLEWDIERTEVEPGHRHPSHLYGLHPSELFNPVDRPEQYEAAILSLESRLAHGGGHTGWSRAWTACLFARIGRGEEVWKHLYALLTDFATVSMLDLHPPRIFQIDGNLGAVEAIIQSLVQNWGGKTHLLRALPSAWPGGRLSGVKVPGGHTLDLSWQNGRLNRIDVVMGYGGRIVLAGLADRFSIPDEALASDGDIFRSNGDVCRSDRDICISDEDICYSDGDICLHGEKDRKFTLTLRQ